MENSSAYALGYLIGFLFMQGLIAVFACLITALLLRIAIRWVAKLEVGYWRCYGASVAGQLASLLLGSVIGIAVGMAGLPQDGVVLFTVLAGFLGVLLAALIYTFILRGPAGERISYGKCLLSMVIVLGLVIAIAVPVVVVVMLFIGGKAVAG